MAVVTEIRRFPVKSCRGEMLTEGIVQAWGLEGDRRWMLVDDLGEAVTIRERRGMVLVHPELRGDGGLTVRDTSGSGLSPLSVDVPTGAEVTRVSLFHGTPFEAAVAAPEAHEWFTKAVGEPVRLVYSDDPARRPANPAYAGPGVPMAFADGYPVHLATVESLADLNDRILEGPMAEQGPLPMVRFRPNVVVSGFPAWAEDGWRRVRIGEGVYRSVKGCPRCAIPTTDELTAERRKEPTATMARFRRWDGAVWFGTNLVCDTPGATVRVGDDVEVLEESDPAEGPPR